MGLGLKECKSLAARMYGLRRSYHVDCLQLWTETVDMLAETVVPMKYVAAFKIACERGGIWPN